MVPQYIIQIQLNLIHVQQSIVTKTKKLIQQQELDLQTLQQVKQKTVNNGQETNEMIGLNDKIIQLQNQLIQNQNTVLFALKEIKNCYRKIESIYEKLT